MHRRRNFLIGLITIIALAIGLSFWFFFLREKPVEGVFEASGPVRGTEVTVSSRVAGRIESFPVKEGQTVNPGDLIARISSKEIEARVEQARSEVDASGNRVKETEARIKGVDTSIEQAEANLKFVREDSLHRIHQAREAVKRAEADIYDAESRWNLAKKDFDRYSQLIKDGIISQRDFEVYEARLKSAEAGLNAARTAREEAKASLERAGASAFEVRAREKEYKGLFDEKERLKASYEISRNQLKGAEAKLREIEATFRDTELHAPSRGTVVNRLAEEGELVAEGAPVATLIDLSDIYVKVYIPELDIGKIRLGNPARIYADAFPGRFFDGNVTEVSQKAEFTPKEVHMKEERTKLVFGVKVGIKNPEGYLKPGMPVDVKIRWKEDAQW